jgi:hypothetical protein
VEDMIISVLAFLILVSAGFAVLAVLVGALGVLTGSRFERCPRCQRLGLMNDRWPQHRSCSPGQLLGGSGNSSAEALASMRHIVQKGVSKGASYGEQVNDSREASLRL